MPYGRAKTLAYARKYWTNACTDGYIGIGTSPFYRKVPNGTIFVRTDDNELARLPDGSTIDDIDDCAHFLSAAWVRSRTRPEEDSPYLVIFHLHFTE
jgi:hypothetical protein